MILKELCHELGGIDLNKEITILVPAQDPIHFDESDTMPNSIAIVCQDDGTILGVVETDKDNKFIKNTVQ